MPKVTITIEDAPQPSDEEATSVSVVFEPPHVKGTPLAPAQRTALLILAHLPKREGSKPVEERLQQIKERVEKATKGPWEAYYRVSPRGAHKNWHIGNEDGLCQITIHGKEADYEFIAHSRADIPWLLTQLTAILAENQRLMEQTADTQMLAFQWMRRHDLIKAGKNSADLPNPSPVDLPESITRAEIAEGRLEKMREALKGMVKRLRAMGMVNSAEICEAVLAE